MKNIVVFVLLALVFFCSAESKAQGNIKVISLSGLIVSGDSSYGIPGVHVYIPNASVGTASNAAGLFRISAMPGDTIVFSHLAYAKQQLVLTDENYEMGMTVLIDMEAESTLLPVLEIFPYPTEELFQEAFLALDLNDKRLENMKKNLDSEAIARMASYTDMSAAANHRYFMLQQTNALHNQYFQPTLSLTNPFAWAKFIQSVKNGDLKKKK
jgi:hypothetical protein